MGMNMKPQYLAALIGVFVLFVILIILNFTLPQNLWGGPSEEKTAVASSSPKIPSPFDGVDITGKAAYVIDLTTGNVLYQKNAQESLPLASVTKLMTALVALDHDDASGATAGDAEKIVTIDQDALNQDGDNGLLLNEHWNMEDLIKFSLIESSNDGATALARNAFAGEDGTTSETNFIQAMNQKAGELGLHSMSFYSDNGLDLTATDASAFGSAQDVARLMATAIGTQRDIIGSTALKAAKFVSLSGIKHTAINTDLIVGELPGLIASKTGYTDLAGGNLVVAFDTGLNHPVIIAVLGSTETGRFDDVLKLASTTMAYFAAGLPQTEISNVNSPAK